MTILGDYRVSLIKHLFPIAVGVGIAGIGVLDVRFVIVEQPVLITVETLDGIWRRIRQRERRRQRVAPQLRSCCPP